jgi:hemoglobin-like flavoprotein
MGENLNLTADEIERVRTSFDQVWAISSRTADLFYDRLFASDPFLRPLQQGQQDEHKQRFMLILAVIVASLDQRADMAAMSERLAQSHAECGLRHDQSALLTDALFWSLEKGLKAIWTPAVAAAWRKAYRRLSEHMVSSAYG